MTNVENIVVRPGIPYPRHEFSPISKAIELGDGTQRGGGWATARWSWGYLTQAQRDALRTYCTGHSAVVFIRTRTNDSADAYANFQATVIWPSMAEEKEMGKRLQFALEFRNLVAQ